MFMSSPQRSKRIVTYRKFAILYSQKRNTTLILTKFKNNRSWIYYKRSTTISTAFTLKAKPIRKTISQLKLKSQIINCKNKRESNRNNNNNRIRSRRGNLISLRESDLLITLVKRMTMMMSNRLEIRRMPKRNRMTKLIISNRR